MGQNCCKQNDPINIVSEYKLLLQNQHPQIDPAQNDKQIKNIKISKVLESKLKTDKNDKQYLFHLIKEDSIDSYLEEGLFWLNTQQISNQGELALQFQFKELGIQGEVFLKQSESISQCTIAELYVDRTTVFNSGLYLSSFIHQVIQGNSVQSSLHGKVKILQFSMTQDQILYISQKDEPDEFGTLIYLGVVMQIGPNYFLWLEKGVEFTDALDDQKVKLIFNSAQNKKKLHLSITRVFPHNGKFICKQYMKIELGQKVEFESLRNYYQYNLQSYFQQEDMQAFDFLQNYSKLSNQMKSELDKLLIIQVQKSIQENQLELKNIHIQNSYLNKQNQVKQAESINQYQCPQPYSQYQESQTISSLQSKKRQAMREQLLSALTLPQQQQTTDLQFTIKTQLPTIDESSYSKSDFNFSKNQREDQIERNQTNLEEIKKPAQKMNANQKASGLNSPGIQIKPQTKKSKLKVINKTKGKFKGKKGEQQIVNEAKGKKKQSQEINK